MNNSQNLPFTTRGPITQMFRSATFKLTLWYVAIIMTICLAFSVIVYHFATNELSMGLRHQTQRIYDSFPVFDNSPYLKPGKDLDIASHHVFLRLIDFNLLVLVLADFASYYLARRTLRPIEAAHKRQERFTADVSHELRTPLTSLKMGSEVALMDNNASKLALREALESNLEEVSKMELLINNLLRLTRLDSHAVQASFRPLTSIPLIEAAHAQVNTVAKAKQVAILVGAEDLPVYGDPDSLIQLLVILLDNAIKYSPPKTKISVESKIGKNHTTHISIRDQGQGIAGDVLPHVFDRFYRADDSRNKATADGFGLGLSIAQLITDTHHGSITLSSRPGHGTMATVTLPEKISQSKH